MNKIKKLFAFKGGISLIFYIGLACLLWYLIVPRTGIYYRRFGYRPYIGQLNKNDIVLIKGETDRVSVIGLNKRVYFSSTDIKVADVNIFGGIRSYRAGTTIIKVKVDGKVLKCRVRVVELSKDTLKLSVGKSKKIRVKGISFGVKWRSEDERIARVTNSGKVIGIKEGKTKITAVVLGKSLTCKVEIKGK